MNNKEYVESILKVGDLVIFNDYLWGVLSFSTEIHGIILKSNDCLIVAKFLSFDEGCVFFDKIWISI